MKIAIISALDFQPWQFRSEFIATLLANGHTVTVVSSDGPYVERLKAIGADHVAIPLNRFIDPLKDFLYVIRLFFTLRRLKPDIVYLMTAKPIFVGSIIAKCARVPRVVALFGGLGFVHAKGGNRAVSVLKAFARMLLRFSSKCTDFFIFQNQDDLEICLNCHIARKEKSIVVNGSGVNLREFSFQSLDNQKISEIRKEFSLDEMGILVTMVSRMARNKGVLEFVDASASFSDRKGKIRFIHAGSFEKGSLEPITEDQVAETPLFKQVGFRNDIKDLLGASDIVVLPSYHREGVPNTLLEAAAMKKPIVTTDNTGCRDVVDDGVNGFLVPVQDSRSLAEAIRKLVDDPELRKKMGDAGYEKILKEFTVESVNKRILEEAFLMKNVRIPDFYTEEIDGRLHVYSDGEHSSVAISPVSKDHVLN